MAINRKLQAATWYHGHGYSVIPASKDKRALVSWEKYQHQRADENQIRQWWKKWPDANPAIVCGEISGIMVVDADSQTGIETVEGFLPDSIMVPTYTTPKGGRHFWFKYRAGLTNGVRVLNDTDFRTNGGIVLVPPGDNGNGKSYRWLEGCKITDADPPPMPEMLFDILEQAGAGAAGASSSEHSFKNKRSFSSTKGENGVTTNDNNDNNDNIGFDEGRRDNTLFHLANHLIKSGMPENNILFYLKFFANHCNPPLSEKDAAAKLKSAKNRSQKREKSLTAEVRELIMTTSGNISTTFVQQMTTMTTRQEKKKVAVVLGRLCDEGLIERTGRVAGEYRIVEREAPAIDIFSVDDSELPLKLPLGLHDIFIPMRKNLIVIAGAPDGGKTAMLLNVCAMNFDSGIPIRYMSSEMGAAELHGRIKKFENIPLEKWRAVDFRERSTGFQDLIIPDGINVIDFLEITDAFYQVSARLTEIFNRLDKGIAIVGLQKDQKKAYGRGDQFSMEKPRLYVTLDQDPPQGNIATIKKCKNWRISGFNPNNRQCVFKIHNGINLNQLTQWHKCKKT